MYHGNVPELVALDMAEQRIKEELCNKPREYEPGLRLAQRILLDTADDCTPRS